MTTDSRKRAASSVVMARAILALSSIAVSAAAQAAHNVDVKVIDSDHVAITINNQEITATNPGPEWTQELLAQIVRRVTEPTLAKVAAYLEQLRKLDERNRKLLAAEVTEPVLAELRALHEQAIRASDPSAAQLLETKIELLLHQRDEFRKDFEFLHDEIVDVKSLLANLDQNAAYVASRRESHFGGALQFLAGAVDQQNSLRPQIGLALTFGWQPCETFGIDMSVVYRVEPSNRGGYNTPTDDLLLEQSDFDRIALGLELAPMFNLLQLSHTAELSAGVPVGVARSKSSGNFEQAGWELAFGARVMGFFRLAPNHGIRLGISVKPTYGFDGTRRYRGFEANYENERTWTTIIQGEFGYGFIM